MSNVSIILPIYNVEKYLRQALDSVVNQTLHDIEIICVNDCSPDSCGAILEEYAKRDDRIRIINLEENQGQGNARNIGIGLVSSDYVMFVDPDDWLELDACETAYKQIIKNKNDFVLFGFREYFQETGDTKEFTSWMLPFEGHIDEPNINLSEIRTNYMANAFSVMRIYNKDFLNKYAIRYSDDRFDQDNIFVVNSWISARDISLIPRPLYNYRIHHKSTSFKTKYWKCIVEARRKSYELIKQRKVERHYMEMFLNYCITAVLHWYDKFAEQDPSVEQDLYNEIRKFFMQIYHEQDCKNIPKRKKFTSFIEDDWAKHRFKTKIKKVMHNLFSIKNLSKGRKKYKVLTILGIKIKFRVDKRKGN